MIYIFTINTTSNITLIYTFTQDVQIQIEVNQGNDSPLMDAICGIKAVRICVSPSNTKLLTCIPINKESYNDNWETSLYQVIKQIPVVEPVKGF